MTVPPELTKEWADQGEAMKLLGGVSRSTIYRLRVDGILESREVLGKVLILRRSIIEYLESAVS